MAAAIDLPTFLAPLDTYLAAPELDMTLGSAEPKGSPLQKIVANVAMSGQEQSNWCWSAVTQAVKHWAGKPRSQTDIATAHISYNGRAHSCASPRAAEFNGRDCGLGSDCSAVCNDPHILSVVLKENEHFSRYLAQDDAPSFDDIVNSVNAGKPVPCRVQWSTDGGHFILVIGWTVDNNGSQLVHVLDPASAPANEPVPERILGFSQFVGAYSVSGVVGVINYAYEV